MKRSILFAAALMLAGCDQRVLRGAEKQSKYLLGEEVICSGSSQGCGSGEGFTCVGRKTGREVYCSADTNGRCVVSDPIGIVLRPAPSAEKTAE